MPTELLLFDLMETVVADPFERTVPDRVGFGVETILSWHSSTAWIDFERGRIDESTYMDQMFRSEGVAPYTPEEFREWMLEGYGFRCGMESLLTHWSGQGHRMAVASNYPCWWKEVRARLQLDRFFESYYVSCDLGVRKPDTEFYRLIQADCGLRPEAMVFIDDREENIVAAQRFGMTGLIFEEAVSLGEELGRLLNPS